MTIETKLRDIISVSLFGETLTMVSTTRSTTKPQFLTDTTCSVRLCFLFFHSKVTIEVELDQT